MGTVIYFYIIGALLLGGGAGYFFKNQDIKSKALKVEAENERKIRVTEQKIYEMEKKSNEQERKAEQKAHEILTKAKDEAHEKTQEIEKQTLRLEQKEEVLTEKVKEVERQKEMYISREASLKEREVKLNEILENEQKELEKIASLTKEAAKEMMFEKIEKTAAEDLINRMKRAEDRIKDEVEGKSREAIIQSIQRLASDVTNEATVTPVSLPSDDYKGRIIGKEGRNIQALERLTGCDFIIDDTPNTVIISGFDLMRRYIAKRTLEKLVEDGRINPARAEEMIEKATNEVDKMVQEFGDQAIYETGVSGIPPEIIKILGRLRFRTSYGQNVLKHSIEVAFLAESLANLLGADAELCKAAGLLHDLGKTVSQEIGGKHAVLTGEIGRKYGVDEKIIATAEAHHEDFPIDTIEKAIILVADAISASRPGARRETAEKFVQRMKDIEAVAGSFKGVNKCYAIQAGREFRIFVDPEEMSDLEAKKLSWNVARKLEADVQFPGEIKVTVFRETRAIEVAK
ncbi:ribonuclease Y [Candidatus Peregrinibacteria bacterium]|nr:ribonuclease Y [Candidatus Peregrinibacteria bacterium]